MEMLPILKLYSGVQSSMEKKMASKSEQNFNLNLEKPYVFVCRKNVLTMI